MTPAERRRRLAELGSMPKVSDDTDGDPEIGYDDVDEQTEDELATAVSGAQEIEALRAEVAELRQLVSHADRVRQMGTERKLAALQACLKKSELRELEDGRGKLLIFTEHRDTLAYLEHHLREWGYTVCTIHGGHPPTERKKIQQDFRLNKQICIATEAAGEGINLQFCHLMVNYDLPWNPVRLEQRMGRVHRIGQEHDCYIFNFCATNTVEGQLLERLHAKLETMKAALQGRVYDVIGDLLTLNGIDFERLVKDTLLNPARIDAAKAQINRMTAAKYQEYQQATGIALARRHVDMEWVRERDFTSEERRLMPEYVEAYFLDAAEQVRLRVERRADTLLRIEHVPLALRSDDLTSVTRLGRPDGEYRKLTFRKEQRERAEHGDAVLCSPGHPLFAAVAESLDRELEARGVPQSAAVFVDPATTEPYNMHLFSYEVVGEDQRGRPEPAYAEVVAVVEERDELHRAPADALHTLTPATSRQAAPPDPQAVKAAENWVRVNVQMPRSSAERAARLEQADVRRAYLEEAMAVQRRRLEDRWSEYDAKVAKGEESYRLLRDTTLNRLKELEHRQKAKLDGFARLGVVRTGKVTYLGTACIVPAAQAEVPDHEIWRPSKEVEDAAMALAMQFEREDGWTPADVSAAHDGSGFDIRSVRRNAQRRHRGPPHRGQGTQHRHGRRRALPDRVVCRGAVGSRILAVHRLPGHQRRAPARPHPGPVPHAAQRRRDQPDHRVPRARGQHRGTRVTSRGQACSDWQASHRGRHPHRRGQPDQREARRSAGGSATPRHCTCGGPGALSPRPGPRSMPRWCRRKDISAARRSWRSSSTRSAAGAARSRRSARRARKCSPPTEASHRKWSTCSPAAGRSRLKLPARVARSPRTNSTPWRI